MRLGRIAGVGMTRFDEELWICTVEETIVAGPAALAVVAIGATVLSTYAQVQSEEAAGKAAASQGQAQLVAAEEQQQADTQAAGQAQAASQRQADAQRLNTAALLSNAQAAAAGGGTTGTDPSVVTTEGQIGARGDYNALTDLYNGNEQAQSLQYQGTQALQGGQYAAAAGNYRNSMASVSEFGTILGGVGQSASLYYKFGSPGFNSSGPGLTGDYGPSDQNIADEW